MDGSMAIFVLDKTEKRSFGTAALDAFVLAFTVKLSNSAHPFFTDLVFEIGISLTRFVKH